MATIHNEAACLSCHSPAARNMRRQASTIAPAFRARHSTSHFRCPDYPVQTRFLEIGLRGLISIKRMHGKSHAGHLPLHCPLTAAHSTHGLAHAAPILPALPLLLLLPPQRTYRHRLSFSRCLLHLFVLPTPPTPPTEARQPTMRILAILAMGLLLCLPVALGHSVFKAYGTSGMYQPFP